MAVKLKDVARELGVSLATVSMAMNNKPGISEATRKRVTDKLMESGYCKDLMRKLPQNPGEEIVFVVCKRHGRVVGDTQFFARIIENVERACRDAGYNLTLIYLNYLSHLSLDEQFARIDRGAQGILVLATELRAEDAERFLSLGPPVVMIDSALVGAKVNKVTIANFDGAYMAARHLCALGHRRIGHLSSADRIQNFDERRAGFLSALRHCGLETAPEDTIPLRANTPEAYEDMLKALSERSELPTAFFADNDVIALGAMRALKECGYRLPQDVSVIGFDDIPACTVIEPALSSMRVECRCIGMAAVKRLVELIRDKDGYFVKQEVDVTLSPRESVRRLDP